MSGSSPLPQPATPGTDKPEPGPYEAGAYRTVLPSEIENAIEAAAQEAFDREFADMGVDLDLVRRQMDEIYAKRKCSSTKDRFMNALSEQALYALRLKGAKWEEGLESVADWAPGRHLHATVKREEKRKNRDNLSDLRDRYHALLDLARDKSLPKELRDDFIEQTGPLLKRLQWVDEANKWHQAAQRRIQLGYEHDGIDGVGGYFRGEGEFKQPAFVSRDFTSNQDMILKLLVTKVLRGRFDISPKIKIRGQKLNKKGTYDYVYAGKHKDVIKMSGRKVLALDLPMLSFNHIMRGVIRVDLDADMPLPELVDKIQEMGVPLPNLIVTYYHDDHKTKVRHPHLYWILRDSVNFGPNGRRRPKNAYVAITDELVRRLRPIGADPGSSRNGLRGKNPLSPHNFTYITNNQPYRLAGATDHRSQDNLQALAELMGLNLTNLVRKPEPGQDIEVDASKSNQPWSIVRALCKKWVGPIKREAAADETGLDGDYKEKFERVVRSEFLALVPEMDTPKGMRLVRKSSSWFWKHHRAWEIQNRAPVMVFNEELTPAQKMNGAARRTNAIRKVKTARKLALAANALAQAMDAAEGVWSVGEFRAFDSLTKSKLAKLAGVSTATPYMVDAKLVDAIRRNLTTEAELLKEIDAHFMDEAKQSPIQTAQPASDEHQLVDHPQEHDTEIVGADRIVGDEIPGSAIGPAVLNEMTDDVSFVLTDTFSTGLDKKHPLSIPDNLPHLLSDLTNKQILAKNGSSSFKSGLIKTKSDNPTVKLAANKASSVDLDGKTDSLAIWGVDGDEDDEIYPDPSLSAAEMRIRTAVDLPLPIDFHIWPESERSQKTLPVSLGNAVFQAFPTIKAKLRDMIESGAYSYPERPKPKVYIEYDFGLLPAF